MCHKVNLTDSLSKPAVHRLFMISRILYSGSSVLIMLIQTYAASMSANEIWTTRQKQAGDAGTRTFSMQTNSGAETTQYKKFGRLSGSESKEDLTI